MERDPEERRFDELSVPEKILHVQDLWDRIADAHADVELTETRRAELERRLQTHEAHPERAVAWDEVRARLERKPR